MLHPADVQARVEQWVWIPDEAQTVETDDYTIIAYPAHYPDPTVALRWSGDRPAAELVDEVLETARGLGRDAVWFYDVDESTDDLERTLRDRGAELTETLAVLALDLGEPRPDIPVPDDLELRPIRTLDDAIALERLDAEVFGGRVRAEEDVAAEHEAKGPDPSWVLAFRDGELVGCAGSTIAGDSVRLWGSGVAESARHTGVYRALLDHRLRAGAAAGARVALVKGRVETSAPSLLRSGFERFGEVRAYRL